jgi:valyl-tRNA synthetase
MLPDYHPKNVEAAWYAWWEKKKFFHADANKVIKGKKMYTMVIPPPNVTGALHLGHALMLSIEDAIMRWRRMNGHETLWLPGVDHAGIAT